MYYGDIRLGNTIDMKFTTRAFATGVPTTLAGTPSVAAYVGNGTTEITAGITLSVDFDSRTGLNNVRVVATGGNGFATATDIDIVITAGTVGGTTVVGETVCSFSIENRSALMPTVAARTLDVTATGAAGIDWGNVENPTTALNLSGTNIDTDQVVASVTGAVGSVTGAVGSVTGAVGSVTGNVGGNVNGNVVGSVASVTARVTANVDQLNGNAQSLLDLKDFADDGYDPATNKVQGVVLVDTLTTYTGNTPQTGDTFALANGVNGFVAIKGDTAAIKLKTDNLPATPAAVGSAMTLTAAYDAAKTAAQAATALDNTVWTNGRAAALDNLDAAISSVLSAIAALNNLSAAEVNTEVNDVINVDTKGELAAVPASNASLGDKLTFIEMKIRNKETQNATDATIANTSGTTIGTAPVSDAAGVFTKGKYV